MKCIRDNKTGVVTREDNEVAIKKVDSGTHSYVSRKVWKEEVRDAKKK